MRFAIPDALLTPLAVLSPVVVPAALMAGQGHVSAVTWGATVALRLAVLLPYRFSLLTYLIGVMAFVSAGQGVAEGRK